MKLSSFQSRALKLIEKSLTQNEKEVFLLQNIDREERLSIYLKAIEFNLKQGNSSIILVPEISLISPLEEQLRSKFGDVVVISVHSRLSQKQLYQRWQRIKNQDSSVVIGTRSAIFAPVKNLKLIIVDEEADSSYKQIEVPRYNAREVALKRAELCRAIVILSSMLPSMESYYNAGAKKCKLITQAKEQKRQDLNLINMRREGYGKQETKPLISKFLEGKIKQALTDKEKIVLFLNRRGFATFIHCSNCKSTLRCKDCDTTLKYHFNKRLLICHQCGYKIAAPEICPQCNAAYVRYSGSGTQRLESELHRLFPSARTLRMDTDALRTKASPRYQEADILAGTQIISKVHFADKPGLVGIVSLDNLLNMPDFRATEHAFRFLMQFVSLLKKGGSLLIQTYFPENYILKFVEQRNYSKFYKQELAQRKDLNLPPFKHIITLTLRGKNESTLTAQAEKLTSSLLKKKPRGVDIIGPLPAPISKLRGKYQQNVIIKTKNVFSTNKFLKENLGGFTKSKIDNIPLTVDVDPL